VINLIKNIWRSKIKNEKFSHLMLKSVKGDERILKALAGKK
jgi:hypothetical protein